MRLAGTWKQYSKKAIIQLMTITLNSGADLYFRWPYQANVMKMLEQVRSRIVLMRNMLPELRDCCWKARFFRGLRRRKLNTLASVPRSTPSFRTARAQ